MSSATNETTHPIGRMTSRIEPSQVSHWYYDSAYADGSPCNHAKGRLCEATAGNSYARRHAYDALGRPSTLTASIGATYQAGVSYDAQGRVAALVTDFAVVDWANAKW